MRAILFSLLLLLGACATPAAMPAALPATPNASEAAVGTPKPVAAASEEVLSDDAGR